jgi:hypothetical protein
VRHHEYPCRWQARCLAEPLGSLQQRPFERLVRCRIVAKADSIGLLVRMLCLTLGMVFKQPLRQTQGLMRSIATLLGAEIAVPDFSTLSRRSNGLILRPRPRTDNQASIQLVVDSTGLEIFGEGAWLEEKHKTNAKSKSWRKLHLGLDLVSGAIVCSGLTTDDIGDTTALPGLLDQVNGPADLFLADGAYDGNPTSVLLAARVGCVSTPSCSMQQRPSIGRLAVNSSERRLPRHDARHRHQALRKSQHRSREKHVH